MQPQKATLASKVLEMTIQKYDDDGQPLETVTLKPEEKIMVRKFPDGRIEEEPITWR